MRQVRATTWSSARTTRPRWWPTGLRTYHEQTEPLKDYYAAQGKLRTIDGTQSIEKTLELALAALGKSE